MSGPDAGADDATPAVDGPTVDVPAGEPAVAEVPDGEAAAATAAAVDGDGEPTSVEDLLEVTEKVTAERDQYLDMLQRAQAEFDNYKKRVAKQQTEQSARATEALVEQLLPVLDAFDGAMSHDAEDVEPLHNALVDVLTKNGLERIDGVGEDFDPNQHDAVMHEEASGESTGPTVAEVMRPGYRWHGRVLRPAMVKVQG